MTLFAAFCLLWSAGAQAIPIYLDTTGGYILATGTSALFKTTKSKTFSSGTGLGFQGTLAMDVISPRSPFQITLGAQYQYFNFTGPSTTYNMQTLLGLMRIQWLHFFVGGGATPLVWKKIQSQKEAGGYSLSSSSLLLQAEAGFLYTITPEIAFVIEGAAEEITISGGGSIPLFFRGFGGFRLFFGNWIGGNRQREYDGNRYPRGWQK